MLAQAVTGTPGHVNAMADAVAHFIRRIGRRKHLMMVTSISPTTRGRVRATCMISRWSRRPFTTASFGRASFACTAHIVDIGGRGFGADAHIPSMKKASTFPIMKFADQGRRWMKP